MYAICPAPVGSAMMRRIEDGMSPEDSEAARKQISMLIPAGRCFNMGVLHDPYYREGVKHSPHVVAYPKIIIQ